MITEKPISLRLSARQSHLLTLSSGGSFWKSTFAAAGLLGTIGLTGDSVAGADDYVFEPVKQEIKASNVATVGVRLVHKPTGKPVTNAVIVQARIDMSPDGMADMAPVVVPLPSREPGVYAFRSPLTMTGRWLLSITARVQGESEVVAGKVIFRATP
jgi:YtkA-like